MKNSKSAILKRVMGFPKADIPPDLARLVLAWQFPQQDKTRMRQLLERAKSGALTTAEMEEAEEYERVGHFLSILRAKARRSLRRTIATA